MFKGIAKLTGVAGYALQYACWTHVTFEYIGDLVCCSGPSMEPTLYSNNVLLTEKLSARHGRLARGDIIVARNPTNPRQFICKRVLGMPGDTVVVHAALQMNPFATGTAHSDIVERDTTATPSAAAAARLSADGCLNADDDDAAESDGGGSKRQRLFRSTVVVVPRGHCWLEGDNAANSSDSRNYGPVPLGLVRSRAVGRVWPPTEMCVF